jgi:phosphotransferase system  glucose/maltose/N-acetylglucosamine-specific IIC component
MTAKEEIQITLSKDKQRRIGTDILLGAFVLVGISGFVLLYMKTTADNIVLHLTLWWWAFIHRIAALVSLIFTMPHIYKHRKWYKRFFSLKRKSKITVILSVGFFITLLTTIALAVRRGSVSLEIIHSGIGIIAVVFILIHALKRYHIIK